MQVLRLVTILLCLCTSFAASYSIHAQLLPKIFSTTAYPSGSLLHEKSMKNICAYNSMHGVETYFIYTSNGNSETNKTALHAALKVNLLFVAEGSIARLANKTKNTIVKLANAFPQRTCTGKDAAYNCKNKINCTILISKHQPTLHSTGDASGNMFSKAVDLSCLIT